MKNILVYGTILFDHINNDFFIGGCHTNVAAHCAKLGMNTTMVSCIGNDALGKDAVNWMQSIGVNTENIAVDKKHQTGTVEVDVTNPQDPQYEILDDVAYDHIQIPKEKFAQLIEKKFDFMYFSTVEQRHDISADTLYVLLDKLDSRYRFFDINLRKDCFTIPRIIKSLEKTDILKVNEEELVFMGESILHLVADEGTIVRKVMEQFSIQIIIVTRSNKGASAFWESKRVDIDSIDTKVVDTVGAGDAFSAAFISCFSETGNIEAALKAGTLLGSYVVGKRSAVPEYTNEILKQVKAYISQY